MTTISHSEDLVLLFDGVCNLCNGAVQFVLKHDRTSQIKFCPLQSEEGKALQLLHDLDPYILSTLVYLRQGEVLLKSRAVIAVLVDMGGFWKIGWVFKIIPPIIGDFFYDLLASLRYKLCGKREHCMVPTEAIKSRFL